ncbi:hypothetical protein [Bosea massiliensis]|uniref:Uncharacterized protein n=1 Tax=Bosea massiliensis TaxID=151419 RepID=A0ABW0NY25_9HYPH
MIEIQGATVDKITVGGTATIAGTLQLVALGGTYQFGSPYTFLTATGGVIGSFATITTDAGFGVGVSSAVSIAGNSAAVTLTAAPLVTTAVAAATANTVAAQKAPVLGLTQTRNITAVALGLDRAVAAGADV